MSCDFVRQSLLDLGLDAATRQRSVEVLTHLQTCAECRQAADEFDRLRGVLEGASADDEPTGGWAAYENRLIRAVHQRPRKSINWLAIAATVLLAVGTFEIGRRIGQTTDHTVALTSVAVTQPTIASASLEPREMSQAVNAFHEVSKVFDGRASWMLVSHDTSDVGVVSNPVDSGRKVLTLRLTVTRARQVVSDADLLVIPGQTANLTVPIAGGQSLRYRIGTSSDEPTRLTVWLEVATPHGGEALGALSTNLNLDPGQKVTAGQLATTAGEYELKIAFSRDTLPEMKP